MGDEVLPIPSPTATASIASHYAQCIQKFDQLFIALDTTDSKCVPAHPDLSMAEDEMGRLRIWAAQGGAHRPGRVSLDHRLREAPHVHRRITELLGELYEDLEEGVISAVSERDWL